MLDEIINCTFLNEKKKKTNKSFKSKEINLFKLGVLKIKLN